MVPVDKHLKFIELAEKRVNNAIRTMRLIGNLANRHNYEYEEKHTRQIVAALEDEVKNLRQKFNSQGNTGSMEFKLKA